ncbi:hypothetical protein F4782DRAFT_372393 [Xylaria castorea]|nr:hypothetical protein F4782DRAFT_372393 [Xylaria castorea]
MASPAKMRRDYENEVRSWGFSNVFTWTDAPNAYYSPHRYNFFRSSFVKDICSSFNHSHNGLTTHLIVDGQLTITYPKDASPSKTTYSVGDRVDVEARRLHEVWVGPQGCTMVIGE